MKEEAQYIAQPDSMSWHSSLFVVSTISFLVSDAEQKYWIIRDAAAFKAICFFFLLDDDQISPRK